MDATKENRKFLHRGLCRRAGKLALVVTNSPCYDVNVFRRFRSCLTSLLIYRLWPLADIIYCADGAANRLYDSFPRETERSIYLPHTILGDLDSIRQEVSDYYR
jgi:hypothetical protein